MLSVANSPIMLNVVMLSVSMLNFVMLNVVAYKLQRKKFLPLRFDQAFYRGDVF
jgi:hypothetical protein